MWSEDCYRQTFVEKALPDKTLLKNVSNLPFVSRILEKVALHKLLSHLQENNLSLNQPTEQDT